MTCKLVTGLKQLDIELISKALGLQSKIPSDWEVCRQGDICEFINGYAYSLSEFRKTGYSIIRIQNLTGGNNYVYSDLDLPEKQFANSGDLLFAWSATFGPYIWNGPKASYHYHIWKLNLKDEVDKRFVYFHLQRISERIKIRGQSGLGMVHMTKSGMERFPFLKPPLREQQKIDYAPKSKIIMTSHLGEKGGDWDEYYLTPEQREDEAERFKSPENETKLLIVVDMLLVGYDVPIVQVMYLDKSLKEHTLLQAIARVNRLYDMAKTYGLIVDYCGITKDLQKALAIFEEEDILGALEPAEKELEELKNRHREAISFFSNMDREDNSAIIEKFEPVNVRDDFEYAFKMFSKALDVILPKKEAEPYKEDFKYLSRKRIMIRNSYEAPGHNLRLDGKKVQQLIDDYVRSLKIEGIMDQREVTYDNFLSYASKFKTEKARTALIKNKARQIIREQAPTNPVYYEKLRERLERIIDEEEKRRKENANYFNQYAQVYKEALDTEEQRKKLGFPTEFEFAIFEELDSIKKDKELSKTVTKKIFKKVSEEAKLIGWKTKRSSEKKMRIDIYDILSENKYPDKSIKVITQRIIDLAKLHL